MTSSPSDRANSVSNPIYRNVLTQFQGKLAEQLNVEQMFILIDGILPFEACLYHQVLPLFVEGSRLNLGMVSPDDVAATDYVRRMVSYVNYSLSTHSITSAALQASLSAYLNYVSMKRSPASLSAPSRSGAHPSSLEEDAWRSPSSPADQSDRQTFILDEAAVQEHQAMLQAEHSAIADTDQPEFLEEEGLGIHVEEQTLTADLTDEEADQPDGQADELTQIQSSSSTLASAQDTTPAFPQPTPVLRIQAAHVHQPIEELASELEPRTLIQELLVRVLESGIGRLYFERQKHGGRVLWSQDGVLKAVLDQLELSYCQALINELKLLMQVQLSPVETPQQVEVERLYQNERLLLRCRFIRGLHGEEATLQVLRGAALKFYEQQQLARLGNDALTLAQELQQKLNEIRNRTLLEPTSTQTSLKALRDLQRALISISEQIHDLQSIRRVGE